MTTPLKQYRATGKTTDLVFLFKYRLNGHMQGFEVLQGEMNDRQLNWLLNEGRFPVSEYAMKAVWMRGEEYREKFTIVAIPADLTFDAFWEAYDNKVKRVMAEKLWEKLSETDKIKCFLALPGYNAYLARKGTSKALMPTFINQKYYEDDWNKG